MGTTEMPFQREGTASPAEKMRHMLRKHRSLVRIVIPPPWRMQCGNIVLVFCQRPGGLHGAKRSSFPPRNANYCSFQCIRYSHATPSNPLRIPLQLPGQEIHLPCSPYLRSMAPFCWQETSDGRFTTPFHPSAPSLISGAGASPTRTSPRQTASSAPAQAPRRQHHTL